MDTKDGSHEQKDVFISYVSEDEALCKQVGEFLRKVGVSRYIDRENIAVGPWSKRITKAISEARIVLPIWTKNFADKANNMAIKELRIAQKHRKPIFPLWFDNSEVPDELEFILGRDLDGIEFYKSEPDPYHALLQVLVDFGIAIRAPSITAEAERVKEKPGASPLPLFHAALDTWCSGETGTSLRNFLSLSPEDGKEIVDLVRSDAIEEACDGSIQALKGTISFAHLRINLICNLIAIGQHGSTQALWRAMACIVALRHSPHLPINTEYERGTLEKDLGQLFREILSRFGSITPDDTSLWTLSEEMGFEDEIAGVIEDGGGIAIQLDGRPTPLAFGPTFVRMFDNDNRLKQKAAALPAVQDLLAFSPDIAMAAYFYRQARHERLLQTCAKSLDGYSAMPHHALRHSAARLLAGSALFTLERYFDAGKLESGNDVCELTRLALRYLRVLHGRDCLTNKDLERVHRAVIALSDSIDIFEISEWMQARLEELARDIESFEDRRMKDLAEGIRRRTVYRVASAAYHRSDFDGVLTLMAPFMKTIEEIPDESLDTLFRSLAQLASRSPGPLLAPMRSVIEEQRRRGRNASDLELREAILRQIAALSARDEMAWFEEKLSAYDACPGSTRTEELLAAAEAALVRAVKRGDSSAVVHVLDCLPDSQKVRTQQIILDLIPKTENQNIQQKLADYLLALYSVPVRLSGQNNQLTANRPDPTEFASRYGPATPMERAQLVSRLRIFAEQLAEQGAYADALDYLADITARLPNDVPLQQTADDFIHEWSARLVNDPEALNRFWQKTNASGNTPSVSRIDVQMPEPIPSATPSALRVDPEREAVLKLLDQLEACEKVENPNLRHSDNTGHKA